MIKTTEQLLARAAAAKEMLDVKFTGSDGKTYIMLCGGGGCTASGANALEEKLHRVIEEKGIGDKVAVRRVGCFGLCSQGPFLRIYPKDVLYRKVTPEDVEEIIDKDVLGGEIVERLLYTDPQTGRKISKQEEIPFYKKQVKIALHGCGVIEPGSFDEALAVGAYQGLANALSKSREEVINDMLASGLRGRGGGGFPTGRNWKFAYDQPEGQKYVVCNGDEGDPGAFMDRSVLEDNPLSVIEGMTIAGYAIGASEGYIYVRAEYPIAVKRLEIAIAQAHEYGLLGENIFGTGFNFDIKIRLGAGAFVCGEETALMRSIEGKRGEPTPRPPFPADKGLFGKPTMLNNVETYANVAQIILKGADWFASMGTEKSKGTKVFALGGKINNTGLVEVPMGTPLRTIIYDIGGGIPNGKKFKAVQTGGPSGGCLPAELLDTPVDYDNLIAAGSMMGSGGMIVMDEDNCMVDIARFFLDFTVDESCGKCTPCRVGTRRMLEILERIVNGKGEEGDIERLEELANTIKSTALCGLGQTAPNPVLSTLKFFRSEYEAHIREKRCPAHHCRALLHYVINPDLCRGCTACTRVCPVEAISGELRKPHQIDTSKCLKCGACAEKCKFHAITRE